MSIIKITGIILIFTITAILIIRRKKKKQSQRKNCFDDFTIQNFLLARILIYNNPEKNKEI